MKVFRFRPPYTKEGRTTHPETANRSGCYLIKENGKLVYVGFSAKNLYKTMYRHFESWNHRQQEVISYKGNRKDYTVRVVLCTALQAAKLEKGLIMKYKPRDNAQKYTSYQIKFSDEKILNDYFETQVSTETPF